jgi:hypothetical protein
MIRGRRPVRRPKFERGQCTYCGEVYILTILGVLRRHQTGGSTCEGSRRPPAKGWTGVR